MAEAAPPSVAFDAAGLARDLLRTIGAGALATVESGGSAPFVSLVGVATDVDGAPVVLVSRLSAHTTNLDADPRASLLLARQGKGDPLAHPRLTVSGLMEPAGEPRLRRRFLARHPKAELYVDFPDFGFRRLVVEGAHLNGGFARAARLVPGDLLAEASSAAAMAAAEEDALAHMNADHADAILLYATRLAGAAPGAWRAVALDPDGIDLAEGARTVRISFPRRATGPGDLRAILVELAAAARAVAPAASA